MHVGIAYMRRRGKRSRHSRRMRTRNFAYLARGPWYQLCRINGPFLLRALISTTLVLRNDSNCKYNFNSSSTHWVHRDKMAVAFQTRHYIFNKKVWILIAVPLKFRGPIDNTPVLVQLTDLSWRGDKALSEPVVAYTQVNYSMRIDCSPQRSQPPDPIWL